MAESAWLVGSVTLPVITADVDGAPLNSAAGSYYLRSATTALSLLAAVGSAATAATGNAHTLVILRNRHIRWSAAGGNWDVDFGTGNGSLLRDLLGANTDTYLGADTYTFENVSPLLWSPGDQATPTTIQDVTGYTVVQQAAMKSADGTQKYTDHYGDETWNELEWNHILPERMRITGTTGEQGGTFHQFFEQCAKYGRRFIWYPDIDEDDASTSTVTWVTGYGPYVLRDVNGDWYRRNVPYADVSSPLDLPLHVVAEFA